MEFGMVVLGAAGLLALIYLLVALVRPEAF